MNKKKKFCYKYCIVPECTSTTYKTPDKIFIHVPLQKNTREKWCKAIKRDLIGPKSVKYICEDHFDLENDAENLIKYKLVGGALKLKPEVCPHKFDCQHGVAVSSSSSLQPFEEIHVPEVPPHEYCNDYMAEQVSNIKFIQEVEKNPCLYDNKLENSNHNISEKTWTEVGKAFNLTGLQAREKWKNLRHIFRQNLKSSLSGSSSNNKPHYLIDAMKFIIPYTKDITSTADDNMLTNENVDIKYEDNETNDTFTYESDPPLSPASHSSSASERKRQLEEIDKHLYEYLKSKITKEESVQTKANKMFLLSLLPDLNNMTSRQIRIFKKKVIDLIQNIMEE